MKKAIFLIAFVLIGFTGMAQVDFGFFIGGHTSLNHRKIISHSRNHHIGMNQTAPGYKAGIRISYPISSYFILANETAYFASAYNLNSTGNRHEFTYLNSYLVLDVLPLPKSNNRFIRGLSVNTGIGVSHRLGISRIDDSEYISKTGATVKTGLRFQKNHWNINAYLDTPLKPYERPPQFGTFKIETYFRNLGISLGYKF